MLSSNLHELNKTPLVGELCGFNYPVKYERVDETKQESIWDRFMEEYHYLGYNSMIGRRLKYLISVEKQFVGAISFCSASYKLGPRDQFIGWDEATRLKYLPNILNNNRFLILPWINVKNLASHVLSTSINQVRVDWKNKFGVEPYLIETFVDLEKYNGTCYKAANWTYLGLTKGFGRVGNSFIYHGHEKGIYVTIINRRFNKMFSPNVGRLIPEKEKIRTMFYGSVVLDKKQLKELCLNKMSAETINNMLTEHLYSYLENFTRKEQKTHFVEIIKGLFSQIDRKNIANISETITNKSVRNLQHFMSTAKFDDEGMHDTYIRDALSILNDSEGMITADGCDFPKKGKYSVGVSSQHCGPLGKTDNCQASVFVGYCSNIGYALLDFALYLPRKWFNDDYAEKREKCHIPEGIPFKTKNEMVSDMINKLKKSGQLQAKYIGVDAFFGKDHKFLDSIPKELIYFADIPHNLYVYYDPLNMKQTGCKASGKKQSYQPALIKTKVNEIIANKDISWNDIILGMGSKGPILSKEKCVKVVEVRDGKPGKNVWLYARELEDGSVKYALCNASMDSSITTIRKASLMRWSIEQNFKECKKYLGMDHYESRIWIAWRRHILFCLIAHLFIVKLRLMFSVTPEDNGPAPHVEEPTLLKDYAEAITQFENNEKITCSTVKRVPSRPQVVMTIGLLMKLLNAFIPKVGKVTKQICNTVNQIAKAFISHTKTKIAIIKEKAKILKDKARKSYRKKNAKTIELKISR